MKDLSNSSYSFWTQFLFISISLFLFLALILYLIYKWRIHLIEKRNFELDNLIKTRTFEINLQKDEILAQKEALLKQQEKISIVYEELTQSIHTAQRIQELNLPPDELIKKHLPEFFSLYLPKDIVSGDFYWMHAKYDKIFIAAVDCTGHGVAGAFMSIIGNNLLTKIVTENSTSNAAEILNNLSEELIRALHQDKADNVSREGMDIALCIIDKDDNMMQFAGANSPLYIIRNNEITEIKGDKRGIGLQKGTGNKPFTNHILEIGGDETFYIFSDGFPSQFGGDDGNEKMKFNRFRQIILEANQSTLNKHKNLIFKRLKEWQKETEQTDDILILGFKVPLS